MLFQMLLNIYSSHNHIFLLKEVLNVSVSLASASSRQMWHLNCMVMLKRIKGGEGKECTKIVLSSELNMKLISTFTEEEWFLCFKLRT